MKLNEVHTVRHGLGIMWFEGVAWENYIQRLLHEASDTKSASMDEVIMHLFIKKELGSLIKVLCAK